jgi:hypothetical protein
MVLMRSFIVVLLGSLVLAACGGEKPYQRELLGEVPPPLETTAATWLNSDPLSLSSLRGKVVYLEFGFHG